LKLVWSKLAARELLLLRRSSIERWGHDVAQRYLEDLQAAVARLSLDPLAARPLKGDYRIHRVRSHYLLLHFDRDLGLLTIARVLHVARDIERHLP
jgi:plasmid stabilization system protein ParE